jgi:hypothetical protein
LRTIILPFSPKKVFLPQRSGKKILSAGRAGGLPRLNLPESLFLSLAAQFFVRQVTAGRKSGPPQGGVSEAKITFSPKRSCGKYAICSALSDTHACAGSDKALFYFLRNLWLM